MVRRNVRQRHVVHETVPVIETHHHTKQVEAPTEARRDIIPRVAQEVCEPPSGR